MTEQAHALLLGDEAVALAALDAGVGAAYGYPGTPSTEILETLIREVGGDPWPVAMWCSNEKTAYEQALGAVMAGRRALVTMKHVGLNVAADAFVNSKLLGMRAGFVVAVADDPGMHSSQNEQDTRYYADFGEAPCLEPASQQEAYDMTRDAFLLSERIGRPVVLRLVTRIAHSRARVERSTPEPIVSGASSGGPDWTLVPANARRLWEKTVAERGRMFHDALASTYNRIETGDPTTDLAVVTAGVTRNYYLEYADELAVRPHHIHIGYHPLCHDLFDSLPESITRVTVFEDGYPYVERELQRFLSKRVTISGRRDGLVPSTGELTPETVRQALGLPAIPVPFEAPELPGRPPRLCRGCPHSDSFAMIADVVGNDESAIVTSDIGCYALGGLGPEGVTDSLVCMGASIGMAKGAAEAGTQTVIATIGDSTFLHSGVSGLVDAVEADTPMTVIILDNSTVAMTGGQPTATTSERIESIVRGTGVPDEHLRVLRPIRTEAGENARILREEVAHRGLSVIIARRECVKLRPGREAAG